MSHFPQSVVDSSAFPAVLLDPSPRGVIQVAIVLLRSISNRHVGFVDKVS